MNHPRIILAGGSGFLGRLLSEDLASRGIDVVVLTRSPSSRSGPVREVGWDGTSVGDWAAELDGAEAVINLAGKNVNCRYTPANRREINQSRVDSVRAIGEAIRRCDRPPKVWVQTASTAIYGDAGDRICDESAPPGTGFPVETCLLWESAFNAELTPATRGVLLRISFVLGRGGGALQMLAGLARWFLGGTVGSGRQYISWIHAADMLRVFRRAIENPETSGVYNATGPNPVTNAHFMRSLRIAVGRPWSPPAPAWAVRLGSWVMRTEAELALTGRRCTPRRLVEGGFQFSFPDVGVALRDLCGEMETANDTSEAAD
jgi:uncharacterized protein